MLLKFEKKYYNINAELSQEQKAGSLGTDEEPKKKKQENTLYLHSSGGEKLELQVKKGGSSGYPEPPPSANLPVCKKIVNS